LILKARSNIQVLIQWIADNIKIDNAANYYNVCISPQGVYELHLADEKSRNIFFVTACRSFGIPARVEVATKLPQYKMNGKWLDVAFEKKESVKSEKGQVVLQNDSKNKGFIPRYSTHYSLAYYKDGKYHTLDYEENSSMLEFPIKLDLAVGKYMLVTGNRQRNGSVLSSLSFFEVKKDHTQTVKVTFVKRMKKIKYMAIWS
jgi:hypothetical protein